jgi:1-deoxy-D-xylulose-5-phosphate reductoisomerase
LEAGGTSTAILNAANEVAVAAFLQRQIRFTDIARLIEQVLQTLPTKPADSLEQILADDAAARHLARELVC